MSHVGVLKEVEDFLRKDLAREVLSTRTKDKRTALINKVSSCITEANERNTKDEFASKQRETSRMQATNTKIPKTPGKVQSDEDSDDGDYYMDLTDINGGPAMNSSLSPPITESYGSGSGYESYASDEDSSTRQKSNEEEDLNSYFSHSYCDIFSYIYLENKTKFLKGKKWAKRIGIVKEKHLKCYKKPGDSTAVLDIPLRGYSTTLKNKEGTSDVIFILAAGPNDGDAHKFYVMRDKVEDWSRVLKEITHSVSDTTNLPPPVAVRPTSTLPPLPAQNASSSATQQRVQNASIQRTPSVGVAERAKSMGDISVVMTDLSPPPVPPGHPTMNSTPTQFNYIGKGLKSAMTDMFKKDKTKKRISVAENLGASVCGYLLVYDTKWSKKWCLVKANKLLIYGKEETPEVQVELTGCDLLPYSDDQERQFGFKLLKDGQEIVYMEANSSTEMGKWVGVLIAETGCAEMPESEPQYMSIEVRTSVMSSAKQAFHNQRETMTEKKAGKSKFYSEEVEEEDELYMDLADSQITPQNISPQKIFPPPLPANNLGSSKNQESENSTESAKDKDKKNKKTKKAVKKTNSDKKSDKTADIKKEKQKQRRKEEKPQPSSPIINSPPVSMQTREIKIVDNKNTTSKQSNDTVKGATTSNKETTQSRNMMDGRRKEMSEKKADIKTKLITLNVKKDELNKYIQAASTEKERGRLRIMLQKVNEEHSKLEREDVALELEMRKMKDESYDIDSPANKRPPSRRERKPINTGATGNVLSKAQMWESGNLK
ncbi:actin filament-associated protein 1-like 1 isoform X1 [Styela clava]